MAKQCANSPQTTESKGQKGPQCADGWQGRERDTQREGEGDAQCVRGGATQSKWSLKRFQKLNGLHFMSFRPTSNATRDSRAEVEPNFWLLVWRRDQSVCTAIEGGLTGEWWRVQTTVSNLRPSPPPLSCCTCGNIIDFCARREARAFHSPLPFSLPLANLLMCWV